MNIEKIRTLARAIGIKPGKLNKTQLIHTIQRQEGNFDCFGSAVNGDCDQLACGWREDCLVSTASKKPAAAKKAAPKKKPDAELKTATKQKPETVKKAAPKKKAATKKKAVAAKKG